MPDHQQIFEDWLAGKISDKQCAEQLQHDSVWYNRMQQTQALQQHARQPVYGNIPHIDTSTMFRQQWQTPAKPQRSWWPQLSLALSCCAMLISLSPLQLQLNDGSLALSWQKSSNNDTLTSVQTLLAQQQQAQQTWLAQQLQLQQQQSAAQLVLLKDYLQDEFQRGQRRDLLEVVDYLNQQREADWHYLQTNYQQMQASQRQPALTYPANYQDNGVVKP